MKKVIFTLLMVLSAVAGMSQTIGEAFYVYRNDGMINTFFRSEIDSIAYSYYDADSLLYEEIVSQVIYTPDSIYQIPLAVIDSVGFVTPETKYQPNAIRLEGEIRDYILGSDSLIVYFRSDTPNNILPKIGDKLVTTEMSEVFEGGFLGQVEQNELRNDTIAVICSAIGLEDVFECFYYSCQSEISPSGSRRISFDGTYSPGPFVFSHTSFLDASIQPVDSPLSFSSSRKFETKISPSFSGKGSIIVHPLKGVVVCLDIKQRNTITEDLVFTGGISVSKDFTPGSIPICAIIPFVYIYGEVGAFLEAGLKASIEQHYSQSLNYNIHYEASYLPIAGLPIATSVPKLSINGCESESSFSAQCMLDGELSGGFYGEIGIALVAKRIASTGFRIKAGLKLHSNVMLYNSDGINALNSTSTYDKLNAASVDVSAFYNVGSKTQLLKVGELDINVVGRDSILAQYKIVPDFTNTTLKRDVNNSLHTIEATTTACGETLIPCSLGFRLFESGGTESFKGPYTYQYWGLGGKPETYSDFFFSLPLSKSYIVYPTVELFGIEMLAEPSAEVGLGATPITLEASDISDTTAKVWGKIEGHELLNESVQFGLGFYEVGTTTHFEQNASTMDEDGKFSVEFVVIKPNTIYKYYAYLIVDQETYYGEEKEFTTKGSDPGSFLSCPDGNHPHVIDLGLPSGTKWACCNAGASTPGNYGYYCTWTERELKQITDSWGSTWSLPSADQFEELIDHATHTWDFQNGESGMKFTGPNGGTIFLPFAGYCWVDYFGTTLFADGSEGCYWSSTPQDSMMIYYFNISSGGLSITPAPYWEGRSIRLVK